MDIRELKRTVVLDSPDTHDEIVAHLDGSVASTELMTLPRNVATLAILQVVEMMVAKATADHEGSVMRLAISGEHPHSFPQYQTAVERPLHALPPALRAIDLHAAPAERRALVTERELRIAGMALLPAAISASTQSFLNDALAGWRSLRADGDTIELLHRSPERLRRRIAGALHAEAHHNARFMEGELSRDERAFYRQLIALQDGANTWEWTRADDLIAGALTAARRAGEQLHEWSVPDDTEIGTLARFTVREFRRVVEVVHAIATVADMIGDPLNTLGASRVLRGPRRTWVDVLTPHSGVDRSHAEAALDFMTRRATDESRGRDPRPATTNPFFDIGGDELCLSVVCTMWQDPVWSLLTTWTRRLAQDYGTKMQQRGHDLARRVHGLFEARGWTTVLEREVPGSDVDVATAVPADRFLIVVEAKAFLDDPVRQAEDLSAWTQLADNVDTVRDPQVLRSTFAREKLQLGTVVGLIVVPGHMTAATETSDDFGSIGVEDLEELVARAQTPRELWALIKESEADDTYPLKVERVKVGRWTLVVDVGDRGALPVAVRAARADQLRER